MRPGGRGWSPGAGGGARGRGWSHDAEPWGRGRGWSQQRGLGQEHSSTFQQGVRRRRRFLGTRVRSAFITYSRERALVLQGPGDVGTRRVSVAQVGAGGCVFLGGSVSLLPNRPAPGLPLPRGGLDPWGVSTLFPAASRPPRSPRHFPNSRHYYSTQVTPVVARRAGKKPGGASEDQMGQGRERGGGGGATL